MGHRRDQRDPRRNPERYLDETAYEAIRHIEDDDERFHKLLWIIREICHLAGFRIEGRIVLTDKKTGKTWR